MPEPLRTRIKICGITEESALFAAVDAGADAVGFNFHPSSKRFIEPAEAWELVGLLPPFVSSVGVFVNASVERFSEVEQTCPTDMTQLHGSEKVDVVRSCGPSVIKAFRFDTQTAARALTRWDAVDEVDAVLIDGPAPGDGVAFDWSALAPALEAFRVEHARAFGKPIILAGGLTPENVAEAIRDVRPYAVDVASGVENEQGEKDPALIEAFCRAVRGADGS